MGASVEAAAASKIAVRLEEPESTPELAPESVDPAMSTAPETPAPIIPTSSLTSVVAASLALASVSGAALMSVEAEVPAGVVEIVVVSAVTVEADALSAAGETT